MRNRTGLVVLAVLLALAAPATSHADEAVMPGNLLRVKQLAAQMALQRAGETLIRRGYAEAGYLGATLRVSKVEPSHRPGDIRVVVQTDIPGMGLLRFRGRARPSGGRPFSLELVGTRGGDHGPARARKSPFGVELTSGCGACSGCQGNPACATRARLVHAPAR